MSTSEATAPRVSCVIPVFNEAARIGGVLAAVSGHPLVGEVIVVDDGSTDGTGGLVAASPGVLLLALERNQGKTRALLAGLLRARGAAILLLDGDLAGLAPEHITALLRPVLDGHADMSISLRQNAPWLWRLIGLDYISGERVVPRELLTPHLDGLRDLPRFGFEVWLNRLCIARQSRIAVVRWPGVLSPFKHAKHGFRNGLRADLSMMRDIFRTVSPLDAARQILAMRRLRIALGPPDGVG